MLDTRKSIVSKLKAVGNTYYELDVQSPTLPCITYKVVNDSVNKYGDSIGYSNVTYEIKVWSTKVSEIAALFETIDEKLKELGLIRTYYSELTAEDVIIGVSRYEGLVKEEFIGGII